MPFPLIWLSFLGVPLSWMVIAVPATQSYNSVTAYDGVNRLKSFSEPPTSGVVTENYSYDAFGNRWAASPAPPTAETRTTQSAYSPQIGSLDGVTTNRAT